MSIESPDRFRGARFTNQRGMTVAEILVALVILGIGLLGLFSVLPISMYGIQEGNQLSTAAFLAEQRLEQLKAAPWTATPAVDCLGTSGTSPSNWSFSSDHAPAGFVGTCTPSGFPDETPSGTTTATPPTKLSDPYGSYTRQVRIRPCNAAGAGCGASDPALRLITVQVSFTPLLAIGGVAQGQPQSVQASMQVAQR